jgi:hypothetical protein
MICRAGSKRACLGSLCETSGRTGSDLGSLPGRRGEKASRTTKISPAYAIERRSPMMVFILRWRSIEEYMRPMSTSEKMRAALTDSHFLAPLIVFLIGLALLIMLH